MKIFAGVVHVEKLAYLLTNVNCLCKHDKIQGDDAAGQTSPVAYYFQIATLREEQHCVYFPGRP